MNAVISPCGKYRYYLQRRVATDGKLFAYFGINPSTADHVIDDQTVKKWIGFTERNGGRGFMVGNVFSYRSRDVKALSSAEDPHGRDHWMHIDQIIARADLLVPCWGRLDKVPRSMRHNMGRLLDALRESGKPVLHFGLTKCGQPKHPQMLGYATPLTPMEF